MVTYDALAVPPAPGYEDPARVVGALAPVPGVIAHSATARCARSRAWGASATGSSGNCLTELADVVLGPCAR